MPEFTYSARTAEGHTRAGTFFSTGAGEAVSELRGRGWIVLDVKAVSATVSSTSSLAVLLNPVSWLPATRFDAELGMQQLATMIRSGLSLLTSLRTATDQVRRPAMVRVWTRIYEKIESGSSFTDAIAVEHRLFPQMVVELVRVGESSGTLETVLGQAADHLERHRSLRTVLLTALMYPSVVLLSAIGVTAFLVISVIPKLRNFIIRQGGHRLPPITQALLDVTNWLNTHLAIILICLSTITATIVVLYRMQATRPHMDALLLRIPVIGGILRLAGTAVMSRGMSLLLQNGITLLDAIGITGGLLVNRAMRRRLEITRQAVIDGEPLGESLLAGREFLPMLGRMTSVGEATGTLDTVLNEVARFHETQLAGTIKRFSLLVEPIVIVVVGGIVGFVYIAFFVALISAASGGR